MGNKLGITEDEVVLKETTGNKWIDIVSVKTDKAIAETKNYSYIKEPYIICLNNANLIVDSFNTTNKCNKLPSQLLQEHEEMKAMLIYSLGYVLHIDLRENIKQLLTKINQ